jgi:hypothetical protein
MVIVVKELVSVVRTIASIAIIVVIFLYYFLNALTYANIIRFAKRVLTSFAFRYVNKFGRAATHIGVKQHNSG